MGRYFGTDGIRGAADMFTAEFLERIVRGLEVKDKRVLIGGDTRESTKHILENLERSLSSNGAREIGNVGVFPTPGINFVMHALVYDYAIDVTASHNPYTDNGIKIFEYTDAGGVKLGDAGRERIEKILENNLPLDFFEASDDAPVFDENERALKYYTNHLTGYLGNQTELSNLRVVLDCANGAVSAIGDQVFAKLGAEVTIVNNDVTFGRKINDGVGSTHTEGLCALIQSGNYDMGAGFDGDGDRCMLVDENGAVVDGDDILAILAKDLALDKIVATVMANQGLLNWGKANGVEVVTSDVGDQNVAKEMRMRNISLGGEQSGHIILPGEAMGDGMLTALMIARVIKKTGKKLSELSSEMEKTPQTLINLSVSADEKARLKESADAKEIITRYEKKLADIDGRVLVRPSGTENVIRITMWGSDQDAIDMFANELAKEVKEVLENGSR